MPDTIVTNPNLTSLFISFTQSITITHPDNETTDCFVTAPDKILLISGMMLHFSASSKFDVYLSNNTHKFSPDSFSIDPTQSVSVEVIEADNSDLFIDAICDICSQVNNLEARKRIVIKNVGETTDTLQSQKIFEILRDFEQLKNKIARLNKN